jgi:transcriptional regulator with XRE-family HTH domain
MLRSRIQHSISIRDLERATGISGKQLRLIEQGKVRQPREETIGAIARALSVDPLALFPLERYPRHRGTRR